MDQFWKYIQVLLVSAIPLIEQRGAIPLGILVYQLDPVLTTVVSFFGSLLPVPFVLLLFNQIFAWMKRFKFFDAINKYIDKKLDNGSKQIQKYKEIGLMIFVGIPLPTTGLWTGSAIGSFLHMPFKKAFTFVALGGIISALLILAMCLFIPSLLGY